MVYFELALYLCLVKQGWLGIVSLRLRPEDLEAIDCCRICGDVVEEGSLTQAC